ncbi:MAG TPA: hypothetical protein VJZ72_08250 [Candidatus Limnocylindrales bacterium]|nr:hypothetical protein [Candidatus Limnocylindrales bacterium]
MAVKVYDLKDIPNRRASASDAAIRPYLEAIRADKAAGDGIAYATKKEASKASVRVLLKARRLADPGDPYPGQRIWEDRSGKWFWAVVPSKRRSR